MERITPPTKVKVAHAISGAGLIVGGIIFTILQVVAILTLEEFLRDEGYSTTSVQLRALPGVWLAKVGVIALVSVCTRSRCCYILDIVFSVICLVGMGLFLLVTLTHLDDVVKLGRLEGCESEPKCEKFYRLIVAALVVEFITYLFVPFNLVMAIVAKRYVTVMMPHTAALQGQVIQTHNGYTINNPPPSGYTVNNPPPSYDHSAATGRFQVQDFGPSDGGYVDLADKKKLTSSYA